MSQPPIELLLEWHDLQTRLRELKDRELSLRKTIFQMQFQQVEGTQRVDLGAGYTLIGVLSCNRLLDTDAVEELRDHALNPDIADRFRALPLDSLIRLKPTLNLTGYRALTAEERNLFDRCLTMAYGTPSLTIEPKK